MHFARTDGQGSFARSFFGLTSRVQSKANYIVRARRREQTNVITWSCLDQFRKAFLPNAIANVWAHLGGLLLTCLSFLIAGLCFDFGVSQLLWFALLVLICRVPPLIYNAQVSLMYIMFLDEHNARFGTDENALLSFDERWKYAFYCLPQRPSLAEMQHEQASFTYSAGHAWLLAAACLITLFGWFTDYPRWFWLNEVARLVVVYDVVMHIQRMASSLTVFALFSRNRFIRYLNRANSYRIIAFALGWYFDDLSTPLLLLLISLTIHYAYSRYSGWQWDSYGIWPVLVSVALLWLKTAFPTSVFASVSWTLCFLPLVWMTALSSLKYARTAFRDVIRYNRTALHIRLANTEGLWSYAPLSAEERPLIEALAADHQLMSIVVKNIVHIGDRALRAFEESERARAQQQKQQ